MNTALVLAGGGIKTAVVAARLAKEHQLLMLHIDYGQPSREMEYQSVQRLAASFPTAKVSTMDISKAGLASGSVHAARDKTNVGSIVEDQGLGGLFPTLLSLAFKPIHQIGTDNIAVGLSRFADHSHLGFAHGEGGSVRLREFVHAFNMVLDALSTSKRRVQIDAPLINLSYLEIVKLADRFQLPVANLWSCWGAGPGPCGHCGGCLQRSKAIAQSVISVSGREKSEVVAPVT
ncbi:MAG: 7-cyano-7-deazaguanine synthase [Planctomycetota bacterium]